MGHAHDQIVGPLHHGLLSARLSRGHEPPLDLETVCTESCQVITWTTMAIIIIIPMTNLMTRRP